MVLPGENLAKYGKKNQPVAQATTETAEPEISRPETQGHGFRQDAESSGPIPQQFEVQEAEARVEAPSVIPSAGNCAGDSGPGRAAGDQTF